MLRPLGSTGLEVSELCLELTPTTSPEQVAGVNLLVCPAGRPPWPVPPGLLVAAPDEEGPLSLLLYPEPAELLAALSRPGPPRIVVCQGRHDSEVAARMPGVQALMVEFHPLALGPERECLQAAASRGVAVLARLPGQDELLGRAPAAVAEQRARILASLEAAFPQHRGHPGQLMARFAMAFEAVVSLVVDPSELAELSGALAMPALTAEEVRRIRRLSLGLAATPAESC